ncbi:MAG TPA: hypothetical protein PKC87_02430 [Candidatus Absconditabacterales bacterium]|nr:hypothetical protein [Candidatus Absconditabacterales bacterium]
MRKYLVGISLSLIVSMGVLFAYDQELVEAYGYAYTVGITTMPTIDQADMNGNLIRSHMAKMMSNYATEVLNLIPNTGKVCNFDDINGETEELKGFITKACQLGLMGVGISSFNPNGIVTRAQFGTVLSRALWGNIHNITSAQYYTEHLKALKDAGIMNMISNPNQLEIRGYVMLMMQRADEMMQTGDISMPTAQVIYSTTGSTTGNVTATLTGRNKIITGVNTYAHVFTENGSFIFYFQDLSGNLGSVTATVNNIVDWSKPTAIIKYSTTGATNSDVIVTLTGRSETLTGVNTYTHTFTGNGNFTFTFSDLAGNTGSIIATVNNIDKTIPTANVLLSPLSGAYISGNIVATLTGYSENLIITNNGGLNNYTFTGNGSFIFNFIDAAGNTGSTTATVTYWTGA